MAKRNPAINPVKKLGKMAGSESKSKSGDQPKFGTVKGFKSGK